jgi:hypothetical protein
VASISGSALWRWLHEDAIRPWYDRSWIFPRDPKFATKASRVFHLYAREWEGKLKEDEFVISADEKNQHSGWSTQTCNRQVPAEYSHAGLN